MYLCDQSWITPVFSVTWSSEIILIYWFDAQNTYLIIINIEIFFFSCMETDTFYFQGFTDE